MRRKALTTRPSAPRAGGVEAGAQLPHERLRGSDALARRLHEGTADDDAVRERADRAGLLAGRDAEADADREVGRRAQAGDRLRQVGGDVVARAGDAEAADEVDE